MGMATQFQFRIIAIMLFLSSMRFSDASTWSHSNSSTSDLILDLGQESQEIEMNEFTTTFLSEFNERLSSGTEKLKLEGRNSSMTRDDLDVIAIITNLHHKRIQLDACDKIEIIYDLLDYDLYGKMVIRLLDLTRSAFNKHLSPSTDEILQNKIDYFEKSIQSVEVTKPEFPPEQENIPRILRSDFFIPELKEEITAMRNRISEELLYLYDLILDFDQYFDEFISACASEFQFSLEHEGEVLIMTHLSEDESEEAQNECLD